MCTWLFPPPHSIVMFNHILLQPNIWQTKNIRKLSFSQKFKRLSFQHSWADYFPPSVSEKSASVLNSGAGFINFFPFVIWEKPFCVVAIKQTWLRVWRLLLSRGILKEHFFSDFWQQHQVVEFALPHTVCVTHATLYKGHGVKQIYFIGITKYFSLAINDTLCYKFA